MLSGLNLLSFSRRTACLSVVRRPITSTHCCSTQPLPQQPFKLLAKIPPRLPHHADADANTRHKVAAGSNKSQVR